MRARYDAVVVGGGAVGAATALALAQGGLRVALFERGPGPASFTALDYDLRVYALSPGSSRFLDGLGLWPLIKAHRASPYEQMRVWEDQPERALQFSAAEVRVPQLGHIVENSLLLDALWKPLRSACTVYERTELAGCEFGEREVLLKLHDGQSCTAAVVIAAEGADSPLRTWAGIDCEGWPYPQQALVCHVQTERPHLRTAWQRFLPTGPLAFLPLADGRSSIVWSSDEAEFLRAMDEADFRRALRDVSQNILGEIHSTTARLTFPLRLLHAQTYVHERLALVGDAAHVIHPLAGQGVNLGLADAEALAAILTVAKAEGRDLGSLRLLKRYERARRADALDMLAMTDGLYRLYRPQTAGLAALRQTGLQAVQSLAPLKDFFVRRALTR